MESIIKRAIDAIDQTMKLCLSATEKSKLTDVRQSFEELVQFCHSIEDHRIDLFCRQLNRLLNNNNSFPLDFWSELQKDIFYILGNKDDPRKTAFGGSFLQRMDLEKELKQREWKFNKNGKEKKNLQEFLNEHEQFFKVYLENCISSHSKLQALNLSEDMTKFSKDFIHVENRTSLHEKLKSIDIEYDCTDRLLYSLNDNHLREKHSSRNIGAYLPSRDRFNIDEEKSRVSLADLLAKHRWIVVLGDPGNSKTTLLRWLTYRFAHAAKERREMVQFVSNHRSPVNIPVRIPIFIRIEEFARWIEYDRSRTLIDYIGEQTDSDEENGEIFKELIRGGHALILLDGLDQISDVEQISDVIRSIEHFLREHVLAPDFISPFDQKFLGNISLFAQLIESQLPTKSTGNQILITSRLVNYQFISIRGPFIQHSLVSLIDYEDAKCLVKKWTKQILQSIVEILREEKIEFNDKKVEKLSDKHSAIIKRIFKEKFQFLRSNSSLLFLISRLIFQSIEVVSLRCRAVIYHLTIEKEFDSWVRYNQTISQDTITYLLTQLAFYLHLQSPSGLIDGFDLEQFCSLILQQENLSTDCTQLGMHTQTILSWFKSNVGIVTGKALNVYSFLHLSFQEYFVAMSLADSQRFSIEQITQRIISFTLHPRFRQSLLLAMGLISWKWSAEKYDQFCRSLFTMTMDYCIPFGTLLFFDSFHDLYRLPSKELIFLALNNLFDHWCSSLSERYFISSLIKLPQTVIGDWIDLRLKNEKSLKKLCLLFLIVYDTYSTGSFAVIFNKHRPSIIYEKLRAIYRTDSSEEFFIDQICRRTIRISYGRILNGFLPSNATSPSKIHPLIISVLIGLCGDIQCFLAERTIDFDSLFSRTHRESSIWILINSHYFDQPDSVRIQHLTRELRQRLDQISKTDVCLDVVETFIGLICLQGVSQPWIYEKYSEYQAFPLALDRLKRTWFYFKQFFTGNHSNDSSQLAFELINSRTKSVMTKFLFLSRKINIDSQSFDIACASAWQKFGLFDWMKRHHHCDFQSPPIFTHLPPQRKLTNIQKKRDFKKKILCFLPQSIQKLFCHIQLPPVVFLSQCLINLENVHEDNDYFLLAFPVLSRLFQENRLENYALVIFREKYAHRKFISECFPKNETKDNETLINIERQRMKNSKDDSRIFAASICLARIYQSQEIISSIRNISDPVLRLLALSIVLDMKHPVIFDHEQRQTLRNEIMCLLTELLGKCSMTLSTLLFIQCYSLDQFFPESFQQMSHQIGQKFIESPKGHQKEAVYLALKQLNYSDLSPYLFEFEKQTENLSDLLHFNSTLFHRYSTETTANSFPLSDGNLLSAMYFVELAFDCQILRMYTATNRLDSKQLSDKHRQFSADHSTKPDLADTISQITVTNLSMMESISIDLQGKHPDELLPIFVRELYDYLCENDHSSNPVPNLIDIALQVAKRNLTGFLNAIRKSTFGEEKFRTQLKSYYQRNANNRQISIQLYAVFSVLTVEFLGMVEQFSIENDEDQYHRLSFEFEQVSDRNAIEKLFQLIQSNITCTKFHMYLTILSSIVRHHHVSITEVHHTLKLDNTVSSDYDRQEPILNLLLECSSIHNNYIQKMQTNIFTENDIEEVYQSDIQDIDRNTNLLSQGNYHLS